MSNTAHTVAGMPASAKSGSPVSAPAGDSHAVTKRLQSELMALMTGGDAGVSAFPDGDSLFSWVGTIRGAAGTVYEGLSYKLSLKFPSVRSPSFEHPVGSQARLGCINEPPLPVNPAFPPGTAEVGAR